MGWKKAQRTPALREAIEDLDRLFGAIAQQKYLHDKGWFTLDWLFAKGQDGGEWNAIKVIERRYRNGSVGSDRSRIQAEAGKYARISQRLPANSTEHES